MYWTTILAYMCSAVAVWVGIYHLMLYLKRPMEKENRSFAAACFSVAAYDFCAAGLYGAETAIAGGHWQQGQLISSAFITYTTTWYATNTFKLKVRKKLIGLGIFLGVLILLNQFTTLGVDLSKPEVKHIEWLGLTYMECKLGDGAALLFITIFVVIAYGFYRFYRQYRKGERHLKYLVIALGLFFVCCLNDILVTEAVYSSVYLVEYGFVLIIIAAAMMLRDKFINLFDLTEATGLRQAALLTTIKGVQPEIQNVVAELATVSESVAAQAAEQASTAKSVSNSIENVRNAADAMTTAALQSRDIAEKTNTSAMTSANNLKHVAEGFSKTMPIMEHLETEISDLSKEIGSTEEILTFIQEIAQQINILAINAAVQAVHAGKKGKGFRVIANELRAMIQVIEAHVVRSHRLLESIRRKAHGSASSTQETARLIRNQVGHLSTVEAAIAGISSAFGEASRQVDVIADASQKQKSTVHEVVAAISQLKTAADYLSTSVATVTTNMDKLKATRTTLDGLMDKIGDTES